MTIRSAVLFGLLAACCIAAAWLFWPRPVVSLPGLSASEIRTLEDAPDDRHRLLVHLTGVLLGRGQDLGPWRKLPADAQPVWTTLYVESCIDGPSGLRGFLPPEPRGDGTTAPPSGSPTLDDAALGYRQLGCLELAACMSDCARSLADRRTASDGFAARYRDLIGAARTARVAYQRQHAAQLAP